MAYTVSDVQSAYAGSLRLVAGESGLARPVHEVGILDYELLPDVKSRFQRVNFYEGQLVLSTFLYAKDNPFLITEAVKYLVSKGSSGLIIKNVFHLQIPDGAIRYANARNFPLFVTVGDSFLFDQVIVAVDHARKQAESLESVQQEIDRLLQDRDDQALAVKHARVLNPSLKNEHRALYVLPGKGSGETPLTAERFETYRERLARTELASYTNFFAPYDDGLLLVVSGERMVGDGGAKAGDAIANLLRAEVLDNEESSAVGLGDAHYELHELPDALTEALCAARFALHQGGGLVRFCDLGVYRMILPLLESAPLLAFAHATLEPIRVHDAETGSQLMETLRAFCDNGQSFARTAQVTGQHENTIRRRLDRIGVLTGLSYHEADQMEQLSLARKVELCREIMG